jgi:hypothetical protein
MRLEFTLFCLQMQTLNLWATSWTHWCTPTYWWGKHCTKWWKCLTIFKLFLLYWGTLWHLQKFLQYIIVEWDGFQSQIVPSSNATPLMIYQNVLVKASETVFRNSSFLTCKHEDNNTKSSRGGCGAKWANGWENVMSVEPGMGQLLFKPQFSSSNGFAKLAPCLVHTDNTIITE